MSWIMLGKKGQSPKPDLNNKWFNTTEPLKSNRKTGCCYFSELFLWWEESTWPKQKFWGGVTMTYILLPTYLTRLPGALVINNCDAVCNCREPHLPSRDILPVGKARSFHLSEPRNASPWLGQRFDELATRHWHKIVLCPQTPTKT